MDQETNVRIEQYLSGSMPAEEIARFENELETNNALAKEVRLAAQLNHHFTGGFEDSHVPKNEYIAKLRTFINSKEAIEIKKQLQEAKTVYATKRDSVLYQKKKFPYWIAASIVALLICTTILFYFQPASPEKLYASYYSESDLPSVVQRNDTTNELLNGVKAFKISDFELALQHLNSLTEASAAAYIYKGMAYTELGKTSNAVAQFDALIHSNFLDASKGHWFKALTYLKVGDTKNAKATLKIITANPTYYKHKDSKRLLEEL